MVGKELWKKFETMEPLGSRLMRIRLKTKQKVDIIVAYGPQAEKRPEEKDEFYENLQKAIKATPKSHILIIAGDFNAKLMKPNSDIERTVIGTEAIYHEECERGMGDGARDNRERLIRLCLENGLAVTSTRFPKPVENKATYKPLGVKRNQEIRERTHEQLDYVISRKEDNITVTDCHTDTKSRLDSNHYPLIATLKVQFRNVKKTEPGAPKYNDKSVWRDKEKLNKTLVELIKNGGLKSHGSWAKANGKLVEERKERARKMERMDQQEHEGTHNRKKARNGQGKRRKGTRTKKPGQKGSQRG